MSRFPKSLSELETWQIANATTGLEARQRFVQFVVLQAIAAGQIGREMAFKGGNALRFVHESPRSTIDLDFSVDGEVEDNKSELRKQINEALTIAARRYGIKLRVQRVERRPADPTKTKPTHEVTIAYALPGDRFYNDFERTERSIPLTVRMEVTFNDCVCEVEARQLSEENPATIRVCVLEDIIAEKLRALLQQKTRHHGRMSRFQDVWDIARYTRLNADNLDKNKISEFLRSKSGIRDIDATKSAYDQEVKQLAMNGYDQLRERTGPDFISFEEAWNTVQQLIAELKIPE